MLTRIDHIGIACFDLDATADFYCRTYGFTVASVESSAEMGVREAMLRVGGTDDGGAQWIQLLEPYGEGGAVADWLAKHGEGVHHIAFGTADVEAATAAARDRGVRSVYPAARPGSRGSLINFLHPKDCHGVLTELVTAAGADGAATGDGPAQPVVQRGVRA
ncbi:methylmalonyl-CoA epimerase [Actinacidiphila sp. DG2A-62]|jgi:methylmalonyl-CoA/ethylmalonyl-CoA epimerase|uniref:methylmalonyl-CoA epimerase n=1 Tax=Actinacidiphila sp. DG2A-62 TaxID=3108821 RepID=UPI002DB92A53|nr:methylmalonyl-CoA epimerase [Actinacidiphila sp. DG2A-62]MEC3996902.1 methylmalonyl-CoA epimerase [Actinacidiphila sp. DG2A-62]